MCFKNVLELLLLELTILFVNGEAFGSERVKECIVPMWNSLP